jgi:putative NADH-flavin reductase
LKHCINANVGNDLVTHLVQRAAAPMPHDYHEQRAWQRSCGSQPDEAIMKIIVFGPTGGTGRQLVAQALAAGHDVTAFTRNPAAIETRPRLSVVAGDTLDPAAVERAIAGHDAVLCALGGRPWRRRARVCSSAIRHIAPAMVKHGVHRLVAISTFGAGETRSQVGWLPRHLLFGFVLRSEVADKEAMERELSGTDLDWTVVRVGLLTDEPARGSWRAADDGSIRGMGKVARADVAAFMLAQLENEAWLRRRPVVMQ